MLSSISINNTQNNNSLIKNLSNENLLSLLNNEISNSEISNNNDKISLLSNGKENIENKSINEKGSKVDVKNIGLTLLGAALGATLAYATFSLALIPTSFLLQLLFAGKLSLQMPENIIQFFQLILSLGALATQYLSPVAGAIAGGKTTSDMLKLQDSTVQDNLKISLEKLKNSQSLEEYIRNGFNLGVEWGKETNTKAGNWANIPLALSTAAILVIPSLALLAATVALGGNIPLTAALTVGALTTLSIPLAIKSFNTVKNFAKEVYGLIGGAIGGAVGAAVGLGSKIINGIKNLFHKDKTSKTKDEFQENTPYKNTGLEKLIESGGKVTENFIKNTSDVLSLTALMNNLINKEQSGLGTVASIISGTIKSLQGASTLKQAAVNNRPEDFKVGIFRFLSGFSMLLSFLAPLFGPLGVLGFTIASISFMGLEKFFEVKNKFSKKEDQNNEQDNQNKLKNSYAVGAAAESFINNLGSLGKYWMGWNSIFGGNYGGLTSIFGLVGSTKDILQGAKMMQMASERNNLKVGIQGFLNVLGGVSLALAALGMGRIFGLASLGIEIIKLVSQITSMIESKENNSSENKGIKEKIKEKIQNIEEEIKFLINKKEEVVSS